MRTYRVISKYEVDNIIGHYPVTPAVRALVTAKLIEIATEEHDESERIKDLPSAQQDIRVEDADIPAHLAQAIEDYDALRAKEAEIRATANRIQESLREAGYTVLERTTTLPRRVYRKPTDAEKTKWDADRKAATDANVERARTRYERLHNWVKVMAGVHIKSITTRVGDDHRALFEEV